MRGLSKNAKALTSTSDSLPVASRSKNRRMYSLISCRADLDEVTRRLPEKTDSKDPSEDPSTPSKKLSVLRAVLGGDILVEFCNKLVYKCRISSRTVVERRPPDNASYIPTDAPSVFSQTIKDWLVFCDLSLSVEDRNPRKGASSKEYPRNGAPTRLPVRT